MTIQTIGGVGPSSDSSNNLCSRAVVTGRTGTGAVGGDVVLGALNFSPVGDHVTAATGCAVGKIAGTQCNSVRMSCMAATEPAGVTSGTVTAGVEGLIIGAVSRHQ